MQAEEELASNLPSFLQTMQKHTQFHEVLHGSSKVLLKTKEEAE